MWVISADAGSIVSVVRMDGKKYPEVAKRHGALDPDETYLVLRTRTKQTLEYVIDALDALNCDSDGWSKPVLDTDSHADYKYRTIVTADEWKQYLTFEVDGITYDSHFKEAAVARQPEPRIPTLYSSLLSTWSAFSKTQDTAPYSGSWSGGSGGAYNYSFKKPDCKNCNHTELTHAYKGDSCNFNKGKANACKCTNYEAKPAPPTANTSGRFCTCSHSISTHAYNNDQPRGKCFGSKCGCQSYTDRDVSKSAQESAAVFEGQITITQPAVKGDLGDKWLTEPDDWQRFEAEQEEEAARHAGGCGWHSFRSCDCGVADEPSESDFHDESCLFWAEDGECDCGNVQHERTCSYTFRECDCGALEVQEVDETLAEYPSLADDLLGQNELTPARQNQSKKSRKRAARRQRHASQSGRGR